MKAPHSVAAACLASLLIAGSALAQAPPAPSDVLVSTAWLDEHRGDADLLLLWTGQGSPPQAFIPGAHALPHESLMTSQGGHDLPPAADLSVAFRRAGVSNGSRVVIYGDPTLAGWLFFALDYLGHPRVALLDGGFEKWRAEGRPVTDRPMAAAAGDFAPQPRPRLKATAADVQALIKGSSAGSGPAASPALLDARSQQEYSLGHIPGAKLVTWQDVFADPKLPVFKSRDALVSLFKGAGVAPGGTATMYCGIGLRASVLYVAAKYAGIDARNYVGSWSDWTAKGLPREPREP